MLENEIRLRSVAFETFPDDPNRKVAKTCRPPFWNWKFFTIERDSSTHTHSDEKNAMASMWCHTNRLVVARGRVGVRLCKCECSRTAGDFPFPIHTRGSSAMFSFCLGFSPPNPAAAGTSTNISRWLKRFVMRRNKVSGDRIGLCFESGKFHRCNRGEMRAQWCDDTKWCDEVIGMKFRCLYIFVKLSCTKLSRPCFFFFRRPPTSCLERSLNMIVKFPLSVKWNVLLGARQKKIWKIKKLIHFIHLQIYY